MLSQLVVLFTFSVIQSHSEQFKCEVIPFETNDVRGTCCIHLKNNLDRPSTEEINRQIQEKINRRRIQDVARSNQRDPGRNGQNRNYESESKPKIVTENVISYGSTSRRVPFIDHIDRNRATERNPIIFEETNYMNSGARNFEPYQESDNIGFNSRAEDNSNRNITSKIRPFPDYVSNQHPKSSMAVKNYSQVEKSNNQKKLDRTIFQGRNETGYNSMDRTVGENEYGNKSNNSIPDLGNRNNVNVPDTCTEGYAKNANGKCVKIFQ